MHFSKEHIFEHSGSLNSSISDLDAILYTALGCRDVTFDPFFRLKEQKKKDIFMFNMNYSGHMEHKEEELVVVKRNTFLLLFPCGK